MQHRMQLKPLPFEQVQAGTKTIELRLNDAKRQGVMPGDSILFVKEPELVETVEVRVIARLHYRTFAELVADFAPESMGREAGDVARPVYYSADDEARYGALGLKIRLMKDDSHEA